MKTGAEFSECGKRRYKLWRIWDEAKPMLLFIGLNPSTANATNDDNTIKKVIKIAKFNGYGGAYMMNCFDFITPHPEFLEVNYDAIDINNRRILETSKVCQDVVFAWGNFKVVSDLVQDRKLSEMFPNAKALHINKNGSPKHPLYCADNSQLIPFKP